MCRYALFALLYGKKSAPLLSFHDNEKLKTENFLQSLAGANHIRPGMGRAHTPRIMTVVP